MVFIINQEHGSCIHYTALHIMKIRLLHSPILAAVGLSAGWHCTFVIGWSKYRFGLPSAPLHCGLTWPQWPQWQSICTALMAGICLPLGLCKGTEKFYMKMEHRNIANSWLCSQEPWLVAPFATIIHAATLQGHKNIAFLSSPFQFKNAISSVQE